MSNIEAKPLRVAQIVGKVVLGGVDVMVMNYYRHIDRSKVQFDFFMDGLDETPIDDEILSLGGRIYKLPAYESGMNANLKRFSELLSGNPYKVVHCHMNTLSLFWLRKAKTAGVPVRIAHSHSTAGKGEAKRNLMKYTLRPFSKRYPNQYCACSEYAGRWMFGNSFFASGKVHVIHNAIDTNAFAYNENDRAETRAGLGIRDELVVGHVGRFVTAKNHEYIISIFEQVRMLRLNAVLLLVGDGPRRSEMEQIVRDKGLSEKVIFTGVRTDTPKLLQAMDCFVLPSRYEGLGIAVVEAQAAGLPCYISKEVPGEVVLTGLCQVLSLQSHAENWAKEIVNYPAYGKRASPTQAINKQGYDIREEAKGLEAYYLSLL